MTTNTSLSFPQRLYNILKSCEEQGREDIISWENDGTAFKVNNLEVFERDLLPRYFDARKYYSFTRALHAYGFKCVRTGRQTGIYSHRHFKRNDPLGPSLMRRKPKGKSKKSAVPSNNAAPNDPSSGEPTNNRAHARSNPRLGVHDGQQIVQIPSLPDNGRRGNDNSSGNETSVFGRFYHEVSSQVSDAATYLLVRLPPGSAGIIDGGNDGIYNMRSSRQIPLSAATTSTTTSSDTLTPPVIQENERKSIAPRHHSLILGRGQMPPVAASRMQEVGTMEPIDGIHLNTNDLDSVSVYQEGSFEPRRLGLSQSDTMIQEVQQQRNLPLPASLEPRSIQEMRDNPDDLNVWYQYLPIIPTPRLQAQLEYASPLSMPLACYCLDISTFGMWWSLIFTVGHTIQSMLTAYGPNTESFTLSPEIGIVPHHFMDMMWMHSHFTFLVLLPDVFGPSSMTLFNYFVMTQALNLSIGVKTNYHHIEAKRGVWNPGRWWLADIVRWIFLGYLGSFFTIYIGEYYGNENLKVIGVFVLNLTVLWVWESYRLLLSIRGRVEHQIRDKKRT